MRGKRDRKEVQSLLAQTYQVRSGISLVVRRRPSLPDEREKREKQKGSESRSITTQHTRHQGSPADSIVGTCRPAVSIVVASWQTCRLCPQTSNLKLDLHLELLDSQGQTDNVRYQFVAEINGRLHVRHPNGLRSQNVLAESSTYRQLLNLSDLLGVELVLFNKHVVSGNHGIFAVSLVNRDKRCKVSCLLEQPYDSDESLMNDDVVAPFPVVALLGLLAELRAVLVEGLCRDFGRRSLKLAIQKADVDCELVRPNIR